MPAQPRAGVPARPHGGQPHRAAPTGGQARRGGPACPPNRGPACPPNRAGGSHTGLPQLAGSHIGLPLRKACMAKFDPEKHHRRSIRLPHYDYAQAGAYFVTLCVQDKACLLGQIRDGETQLNDAGQMVARWWDELNRKFPGVRTDAVVIMPNHVHGILVIETAPCAGQAERICRGGPACPPDQPAGSHTGLPQQVDRHVGAGLRARPTAGLRARPTAQGAATQGCPNWRAAT